MFGYTILGMLLTKSGEQNSIYLSSLFNATAKPLVIMKNKSEDKKARSHRGKKKALRPGKRFREAVKPQVSHKKRNQQVSHTA